MSTVGVTAIPSGADAAPPSGNEASVPVRLSAPAALPVAEDPGHRLATPVWPSAVEFPVDLAALQAGQLRSAPASDKTSVVSVGPAAPDATAPSAVGGNVAVTPAPTAVDVRVMDRASITRAGGQALGVVIDRTDDVDSSGVVAVSVDYSGFAQAFGGDFAGRLRLVELPACSLTTPTVEECTRPVAVDAVNDPVTHTISGVVDVNADPAATAGIGGRGTGMNSLSAGSVLTLTASSSSDSGDFRATDLKPSGTWDVSIGSGSFSYDLPVALPPPAEGTAPSLAFDYDSQSVDGMTSATNNQVSQVGIGWGLSSAYVERRYRNCQADGQGPIEEDLCWYSPGGSADPSGSDYRMVLGGQSSALVPDASTAGQYHLTDDPGWLIQHHVGGPNSDDTGEWWQVFTPAGTTYYLGYGQDSKTGAATNSVETVPVFGNDVGEPCHGNWSSNEASRVPCTQAWRWNLDRISDPNEIVTSYHYVKETNSYRSVEGPNMSRTYDRAVDLTEIDYGWASQLAGTNYTDKVVLGYYGRCLTRMADTDPIRNVDPSCPSITSTPGDYPDVPTDKLCSDAQGNSNGCAGPVTSYAPVFFSTQMLWDITTYTLTVAQTATEVMHDQLRHGLPDAGSGAFLWFDYLQRQGFAGTGAAVILPVIDFTGAGSTGDLDNVVGATTLRFRRISSIHNDLGGVVSITYGLPDACTTSTLPTESNNHKDCFKQQWTPDGTTTPKTNWFNKYLVTEVDSDPNVGVGTGHDGDPVRTTTYDYGTAGAGWRFPADPEQQRIDESWTEWRGYNSVTVTHGLGAVAHATGYWIFQGLDGDRTNTSGTTTKSVQVSGSGVGPSIGPLNDSPWLAGRVYEESNRDDTATSHQYVVHNFGFVHDTANYSGLPDARTVKEDKTFTYDKISTSTQSDIASWRASETQSIYDMTDDATKYFGLPARTEDDGELGVSDNSCVTYGYAYNRDPANGRWIALTDEVRHYADLCVNRLSTNQDSYTATLYDNATTVVGDVPFDGNPTEVDTHTSASAFTKVQHGYDAGGRITSVTDGNNNTTSTQYTPNAGWPSSVAVTTPVPDVTAQDVYGQSSSKTTLTNTMASSPATGMPTSVLDCNGLTTTFQYDTVGRLTAVWRPGDGVAPSPAGLLFTYTIPDSGANNTGVPDVVTGPAVTELQTRQSGSTYLAGFTYLDGLGQVRETQGHAGDGSTGRLVTTTRFDSSGYTEGSSAPYYNSSAPGSGMVNPDTTTLPAYRDLVVDWAGRVVETQLQHLGVSQTMEDVHTSYNQDITTTTPPVGPATDRYTDVFGKTTRLVQHTPGLYGPNHTVTTDYAYDDMGRLTQVTDANGDDSTYTYNWAGQKIAGSDPDTGGITIGYDANGDVASATDALGQTITTLYDALNRPTTTWAGAAGTGTRLAFFTYDTATLGKGKPASSTSYDAGNAYTETIDGYDTGGRGLGTTVTIPSVEGLLAGSYDTTTSAYDAAGHLLTLGYPAVGTATSALAAETVTTGYNDRGEPKQLTGTLGTTTYVSATSYLNWGPLSSRTYGAGTLTATRTYSWNQTTAWLNNIATTITNGGAPTVAQDDTYGYDNAGEIREVASTAGTAQQQCFSYDVLNRLAAAYTTTTATVPASIVANCGVATPNHTGGVAPYDFGYTYDSKGLGNLSTVTDSMTVTPTTSAYTYPPDLGITPTIQPHAVAAVTRSGGATGTDNYGYNADGAMNTRTVAGVVSTLAWNPLQRLASVTASGNSTSFVYDAGGNRLIRRSPTETVLFLPGQELHLAGTVIAPTRYYTCGSTVAQRVGGTGTLTWLTGDNQNSAQVAINSTTGAYTQQRYLPFGDQRGTQGPPTGSNRSFLGHTSDPSTGLLEDGARYYDPTLARFISPDPIATPYDPQNLNAYSYAANNPTSASDPSGLLRGSSTPCADGGGGVCAPGSGSIPTGGDAGSGSPLNNPVDKDSARFMYLHGYVPTGTTVTPTYVDALNWATSTGAAHWYWACEHMFGGSTSGCHSAEYIKPLTGKDWLEAAEFAAVQVVLIVLAGVSDGLSGLVDGLVEDLVGLGLSQEATAAVLQLETDGSMFAEDAIGARAFGCSFTADTNVLMADGSHKTIESIKVGDRVMATDPLTNVTLSEPVTRRHVNHDTDLADLTVIINNRPAVLHTTQNHPFWDATTHRWTPAADLRAGDRLQTANGRPATVGKVTVWIASKDMFNLTINSIHTYYVIAGTTPVLVHNTGPSGCGTGIAEDLGNLSPGRQSYVRTVSTEDELQGLYNKWSQGGTDITSNGYNGTMVRLPDGTTVGWRNSSSSGGATIDIKLPNGTVQKVHIDGS